jgi:hypothetical protein
VADAREFGIPRRGSGGVERRDGRDGRGEIGGRVR